MITKTNLADRKVSGHLGNQLWQIAFMIATAEREGTNYFVPTNFEYREWFPRLCYADIKYCPRQFHEPKEMSRDDERYWEAFGYEDAIYLCKDIHGYFQCYDHIKGCEVDIVKVMYPEGLEGRSFCNCVSMHVRAGDYKKTSGYHHIAQADYYCNALDLISHEDKLEGITIFTDDWEYFKERILPLLPSAYKYKRNDSKKDIYVLMDMTASKHIIACASSFSWWASFYRFFLKTVKEYKEDGICTMPSKWFGDFVPIDHKGVYPPYAIIVDSK